MGLEQLAVLKIGDVMSRKVVTVLSDDTVLHAVQKMDTMGIGAVVVVDHRQRVIGIFTERDLMTKVAAQEMDLKTTRISEVMTEDPRTLSTDMEILSAFQLFQDGAFRHSPVVDDGKLVGMVSVKDIHKVVNDFFIKVLFGKK